ncbi:hypothetical protein [Leifsonia sp. fls2-241-R2A-40a]|uniref:hypothetical protein n=1 Tax=Leifsonia sp. fls2-241-R2A-40a TaxID=3040290 RepID=UPI00254CB0C7|nr:hypothetical protein [Leifsonia sp. fls2-241-R2A-40a]
MNGSRLRPKVVLRWGIGLAVAGLLLAVLVPQVFFSVILPTSTSSPLDQGLMAFVDVLTRVLALGVVPLGVAFIGAGIVMTYLDRLLGVAQPEFEKGAAPVE